MKLGLRDSVRNAFATDEKATHVHEMVHVKQYIRKELFSDVNFYKSREEYLSLPWEIEAYEKQETLFEKWNGQTKYPPQKKKNFFL